MSQRSEVKDFLTSRRAKLTPDQAGLPTYGRVRRVPGLRREEVALLAGVSIDYYTRLERGDLSGASDSVLHAIANALQLDDAEREHLTNLARAAGAGRHRARSRQTSDTVRASVHRILESITDAPAMIRNGRRDILAANRLGRALYSPLYEAAAGSGERDVNLARFVFLDPPAKTYFLDWSRSAADMVAALRTEAGRTPYDRDLSDLIGQLCTRSEEFSQLWADHNVRFHSSGAKGLHHPVVGDLHLNFEAMTLPNDPGLSLVVYSAEPDSPTEDALRLLASWAATQDATTADVHQDVREQTSTQPNS